MPNPTINQSIDPTTPTSGQSPRTDFNSVVLDIHTRLSRLEANAAGGPLLQSVDANNGSILNQARLGVNAAGQLTITQVPVTSTASAPVSAPPAVPVGGQFKCVTLTTVSYTAQAWDYVDGGSMTTLVTLPTTPPDGSPVAIEPNQYSPVTVQAPIGIWRYGTWWDPANTATPIIVSWPYTATFIYLAAGGYWSTLSDTTPH